MPFLTLVLLLLSLISLTACSPKAVYIQGGEKASATIDVSAVGGKIELRGPFVYCGDSTATGNGETLLNCPVIAPKE